MRDFNIKAQADPSGFNASLAARFKIGDVQITTVLSPIEKPADAYRVLRLGEMSRQPTDRVTEQYPSTKGQGWGNLAKSLGIKPGSKEFHALKRGHDLDGGSSGKSKGKGHLPFSHGPSARLREQGWCTKGCGQTHPFLLCIYCNQGRSLCTICLQTALARAFQV